MIYGYVLVGLLVVAFVITFFNVESRSRRRLVQFERDAELRTQQLKQALQEREKLQSVINDQNWTLTEAVERIDSLERRLRKLDALADRAERTIARYRELLDDPR